MECIEKIALKPSFCREAIAMNSIQQHYHQQQAFCDDIFCCPTGDQEFPIDDLLDFSNDSNASDDLFVEEEEKDSVSESSHDDVSNSTVFSDSGDFGVVPAEELAVPVDDLENLEWLSRFVDDSASEFPPLHPVGEEKTGSCVENRFEPGSKLNIWRPPCLQATIPTKPRTKRPTTTRRVWSLDSPSLSESSSSSSPSSSFSTSCLIFTNTVQVQPMEFLYGFTKPPAAKKQKMMVKPEVPKAEPAVGPQIQRRCSHCQVQKTPQWRTGPHGAKTLCNACGVRFKSGRLYPEYRPACSPTFSGDIHSNSHRKVLEIRQKKEMTGPDSGLTTMVSSC